MDGVFMGKMVKFLCIGLCVMVLLCAAQLLADKYVLRNELIRLHVVANSDTAADQNTKLLVRDAVVRYLEPMLRELQTQKQARGYLEENLPAVEAAAASCLRNLGVQDAVRVRLVEEPFGKREYDTFSLPSGMYTSLRIEIGRGEGKNWWCVIFPSLCLDAFRDTAVAAGFSQPLTDTLAGEDGYTVRFFLLDCLGRVENFLFEK